MNIEEYTEVLALQDFEDIDMSGEKEECCICLTEMRKLKDGIRLPCCQNMIHPCCLIKSMYKVSIKCPLCRSGNDIIFGLKNNDKILLGSIVKLILQKMTIELLCGKNKSDKRMILFKSNSKTILAKIGKFYNNIEKDFEVFF